MNFRDLVASDMNVRLGLLKLCVRYLVTPTVSASVLLRASDRLLARGWTWPSRLARARLANKHGVHIAEGALIGPAFRLPHPVNVIVGPGAVIGERVSLYQGVTIGAAAPRTEDWVFPRLGDGVTVYANSVVAGDVHLGDQSVVGAGAVITVSVPAGATAVGYNTLRPPPGEGDAQVQE